MFLRRRCAKLSRREFLQFSAMGLAGLFLPGRLVKAPLLDFSQSKGYELLGRVALSGYELFDAPSVNADVIRTLNKDSVWRITGATLGEDDDSPNRIWYELDQRGYAHSRRIQPVRRIFNNADQNIPDEGCLGEITVPYADAYDQVDGDRALAYRFYYAATFWVLKRLRHPGGGLWYQLLDDRNHQVYYVPSYYVRLVPEEELSPLASDVPWDAKKIVVDLDTQILTAYEADRVVFMSRISSGIRLKGGGFATPTGYFRISRKRPCRHMANPANDYGGGFDLPGVPWVSYFTSAGVAFHGAYWHNNFGVPHSHGCINMIPQAAKWVYRWTTPTVPPEKYVYAGEQGTRVIIQ